MNRGQQRDDRVAHLPDSQSANIQLTMTDAGPNSQYRAYPHIHHDNTHELSEIAGGTTNFLTPSAGGADTGDMDGFYAEISSLQDSLKIFHSNITRIDVLHSQLLNNADDAVSQRSAALLAELTEEMSALTELGATLKRRIQALERQPSRERDVQVRMQQIALIKSKFLDMIQSYKQAEERYRQKYQLRMELQFKLVKPDATPEEIRAVVNDESGGQIFSQALRNLDFHVQAQHQDIQRIDQTIAELAQLFNDMNIVVEQQGVVIDNIETKAVTAERDLEAELARANVAIASARATKRRLRCCVIVLAIVVIVIVVVIVVAVAVGSQR